MFFLRYLFSTIDLLLEENSAHQLAMGLAAGWWLGFNPVASLQWGVVLLIVLLARWNWLTVILGFPLGQTLALVAAPASHSLAEALLTRFTPFWTALYHAPVMPLSFFYDTQVLGCFLISVVGVGPFYLFSRYLLQRFEMPFSRWIWNSAIWRVVSHTRLYRMYAQYQTAK